MTTAAPVVALQDAAVRLGGRTVWSGVSLEVRAGELLAVLGPNGAGKSTLLRVILGLDRLAAGRISVFGGPTGHGNERIGYLPQQRTGDARLRVRGVDLVRLGLDGGRWGAPGPVALRPAARRRRRAETAQVEEILELCGATPFARRPIGELSGGEQQRLLIAQALVRRPELLILDEPLDGLDLPSQGSIAALVRRVSHERGIAALLVAHDVNPVVDWLDGVIYLAGGRAEQGRVDEVIDSATLSRLYGAPIEVLRTPGGRLVVVGAPEAPHHHGTRHG